MPRTSSEGTFDRRVELPMPTCLYQHNRCRLHTVPFNTERQRSCKYQFKSRWFWNYSPHLKQFLPWNIFFFAESADGPLSDVRNTIKQALKLSKSGSAESIIPRT